MKKINACFLNFNFMGAIDTPFCTLMCTFFSYKGRVVRLKKLVSIQICLGRRKERNYDEIGERRSGTAIPRNPDREPVYDRPGSAYVGQLDTRSDGSSSGRPDSRQGGVGVSFSLQPEPGQQYAPQDLYRQVEKQAPRYPARTDNRYPSRTENRYPYPTTYTSNSPPPVIYSEARLEQDAAVTRTARKVSSHIGADLDDRIRKVSGVNGYY